MAKDVFTRDWYWDVDSYKPPQSPKRTNYKSRIRDHKRRNISHKRKSRIRERKMYPTYKGTRITISRVMDYKYRVLASPRLKSCDTHSVHGSLCAIVSYVEHYDFWYRASGIELIRHTQDLVKEKIQDIYKKTGIAL